MPGLIVSVYWEKSTSGFRGIQVKFALRDVTGTAEKQKAWLSLIIHNKGSVKALNALFFMRIGRIIR